MITVTSWGIAGSVVGLGTVGRAWLGQSRGGAVDLAGAALANRLVGNRTAAMCLETSGGLTLRLERSAMVAVAGAGAEVVVTHGPPVGWGSPVVLPAGAVLHVRRVHDGARAYLAVRGGVTQLDDSLEIGDDPGAPAATHPASPAARTHTVRVWPGPRLDWAAAGAWQALLAATFTVADTSRVGVRLDGPSIGRAVHRELPSEGMVEGAVQLPPDGRPVVMLADHPTTGGYPVIAVVDPAAMVVVAQAAVGEPLRFVAAG
ncbi:MAG: biotin-dependent carboxyltransferase family protein [Actinomycetota bacterium]|nr:biotin-dependent carboxyltransferase family protein [Actinomycetota bacterium]